jgi:hypothetical protein
MNYSTACELLGFTTPKSLEANARLAKSRLQTMAPNAPLRFKVACQVLIDAAK